MARSTDRGPASAGSRYLSLLAGLLLVLPSILYADVERVDPAAAVAWIDGEPLTVAQVLPHLEPPPPRVGLVPPADPRAAALDEALRVHLLDLQARHRFAEAGESVDEPGSELDRARRLRALVAEETARFDLHADAVDPAEARALYEADCRRFNRLDEVEVAAIPVTDPALAERLLTQAAATDVEGFARLARLHSEGFDTLGSAGRMVIAGDGDGADPAVVRVALRMRRVGEVGLAELDDRRLILRAVRVESRCSPWSPRLESRVRNLLAHERREEHLRTWADRLRSRSDVVVDQALLESLAVPRWDDPEVLE